MIQTLHQLAVNCSIITFPNSFSKSNIKTIVEVGSGKVLTGLNKRMKISQKLMNLDSMADIENFVKIVGENL